MAIHVYAIPSGEIVSPDFTVTANGQGVPVHEARVSAYPFNRRWPGHQRSMDQSELIGFAAWETDGPTEVTVVSRRPFSQAIIRPQSRNVLPRVEGNTLVFTINEPGGYTVELDGYHHALHLFVDPVKAYDVKPDDPDTLYFGPGVHDAGMITLRSNQTVYLEAGSVVYATLHAADAENIRILGRGILDNSKNTEEILFEMDRLGSGDFDVKNSRREHTLQFTRVRGIEIDGITIRHSLVYNVAAYGCENMSVSNVKLIGCWRYNTDGIDVHNTSHVRIRDCFLRTYDDAVCVKGWIGYPQVCEDILVERCTIWCDWGKALEIGAETCAERIHDIRFRDCDIIRGSSVMLDICNVDYAEVYDVVFEDIRTEYDAVSQRPQIQTRDEDEFVTDPDSPYMPRLMTAHTIKHPEYSEGRERRGRIHDITFRRIHVRADRMPPSYFAGYDEEHRTSRIRIADLYLNGEKLTAADDANIQIDRFADSPSIN